MTCVSSRLFYVITFWFRWRLPTSIPLTTTLSNTDDDNDYDDDGTSTVAKCKGW